MRIAALQLFAALLCHAESAHVWHSRDMSRPLPAKGDIALEGLGNFGNHRANRVTRERSGQAEIHQRAADLFVVQAGEATLITGGRITGGKPTTPGEVRGAAIEGGQKQTIAAGDIVHVPAGVAHQVVLAPGGRITYFALKIDAPATLKLDPR